MTWEGALLIVLALLVCAELYAMRNMIRDLRDEVQQLKKRLISKIQHDYDKEEND